MNRTKLIAALLCMTACVGLVSGCGKQAPGSSSAMAESSAAAQSAAVSSSAVSSAQSAAVSSSAVSSAQSAAPQSEKGTEDALPDALPLDFIFASGAGGWGTALTLNADGSFSGQYSDSDMGDQGEGYPHGTVYTSTFSGQFSDVKKLDDHSYSLTLTSLKTEGTLNEEKIEDQIRYVTSQPYGVEHGTDFILYTPDTPVKGLSDDFLSWWPLRSGSDSMPDTLGCYGLWNVDNGYGFFTGE